MKLLGPPNCLIWTKSTSAAPHNRWVSGADMKLMKVPTSLVELGYQSGKKDTPSKKSKIPYLLLGIMTTGPCFQFFAT